MKKEFGRDHISKLIAKDLARTITPAENEELEAWVNASPSNKIFMSIYMERERATKMMKASLTYDSRRIRDLINKSIGESILH